MRPWLRERALRALARGIRENLELVAWVGGLAYLAATPAYDGRHFTLCVLRLAGFDWCPGCGLGRAVALLLRGEITRSLHTHPLALASVVLLVSRIGELLGQKTRPASAGSASTGSASKGGQHGQRASVPAVP